jgi:predicted small integral membrane protein
MKKEICASAGKTSLVVQVILLALMKTVGNFKTYKCNWVVVHGSLDVTAERMD